MFEVAIRMPKKLGGDIQYNKWLYKNIKDRGQKVYRGSIIGRLSVDWTDYTINVYCPIDGVISDVANLPNGSLTAFGNNEPDEGQIILKISTSENLEASSSEDMAFMAFEEMINLFKELSKSKSVPSTEVVKNSLKHAVSTHTM